MVHKEEIKIAGPYDAFVASSSALICKTTTNRKVCRRAQVKSLKKIQNNKHGIFYPGDLILCVFFCVEQGCGPISLW